MIKAAQLEKGTTLEANTKEIMIALGEILGKDISAVEDLLNESPQGHYFGGFGVADKKEIEILKFDNNRMKKELEQAKRFQDVKVEFII
jgi:hypothetical protein